MFCFRNAQATNGVQWPTRAILRGRHNYSSDSRRSDLVRGADGGANVVREAKALQALQIQRY